WAELRLKVIFGGSELVAFCPVTLEGSFHARTFAKVVGGLVGYVTRAVVQEASCRGEAGEASAMRVQALTETLPWHVRYRAFVSLLPNPTAIRLDVVGAALRAVIAPFGECLFTSSATRPLVVDLGLGRSHEATTVRVEESLIPFTRGVAPCPESAQPGGIGT